jgi:hypothetical protein
MKVRIEIASHDAEGLAALRVIERRLFPGEHAIVNLGTFYVLELSEQRAEYLGDLLHAELSDPAFQNFPDWRARNEDQQELFVGSTVDVPPWDEMLLGLLHRERAA